MVEHLRARKAGVQGQERCSQGAASIAALRLAQQVLLEVFGCILGSLPPPVAIKDPCTSCLPHVTHAEHPVPQRAKIAWMISIPGGKAVHVMASHLRDVCQAWHW